MRSVHLAIAVLSVIGFSCSIEGPNHEIENIMYLNISDEDNEYYFEGSDVNESKTFIADIKENDDHIEYLSQCTSLLPQGTLNLTVRFIQTAPEDAQELEPLELTLGTYTNSKMSEDLTFAFAHTDVDGVTWECCVDGSPENNIENKITIQQIEPYHSKVDGTTKQLITMSFEATMINSEGQMKSLNGHMKSIVEGQLP